ncbi:MAG: NAD-dependent epimerase/dehydratase family protein [Chloroflexota bacterium]
MKKKRVILITGVSGYWGTQVAGRLVSECKTHESDLQVIGLDTEPPGDELKGMDFIQADIRNPLFVELLKSEQVDTVCHLVFVESQCPTEPTFDVNVMGTMKVLGACAEAGVRKVVLKSSMSVYGATPGNPAFISEQAPLQAGRAYGATRHLAEIESFCNGFRRQVPEMILTILRFSSIVGPKVDSPLTRFLKQPLAPKLMGFDPLMQVIHEKDVAEALVYAILNDVPGVFNVAAEGILPLSKLTALAAKMPVPLFHLFAYWGVSAANTVGVSLSHYWPIEMDYLRYPWVGDLARMREELGYVPRYTAEEALREFAGEQRVRQYMPESAALAYDEERLRDTIERRKRGRDIGQPQMNEVEEASYGG